MLAVEKWGVDKPKLVVMVAQQLASSSPAVIEMFQEWKSNPTGIGIQPDLKTWVKLYRQHRKYIRFSSNTFFRTQHVFPVQSLPMLMSCSKLIRLFRGLMLMRLTNFGKS